jgi:hypothetical protein
MMHLQRNFTAESAKSAEKDKEKFMIFSSSFSAISVISAVKSVAHQPALRSYFSRSKASCWRRWTSGA